MHAQYTSCFGYLTYGDGYKPTPCKNAIMSHYQVALLRSPSSMVGPTQSLQILSKRTKVNTNINNKFWNQTNMPTVHQYIKKTTNQVPHRIQVGSEYAAARQT